MSSDNLGFTIKINEDLTVLNFYRKPYNIYNLKNTWKDYENRTTSHQ
jgi:hypothetical protein